MTNDENFGKKLKELRLEKSLTQEHLAKLCGINQAQVARYEKGHNMPTKRTINQIAKGLDVSIEYFSNGFMVPNASLDADYEKLRDSISDPEDKLVLSKILRSLYLTVETKRVYHGAVKN